MNIAFSIVHVGLAAVLFLAGYVYGRVRRLSPREELTDRSQLQRELAEAQASHQLAMRQLSETTRFHRAELTDILSTLLELSPDILPELTRAYRHRSMRSDGQEDTDSDRNED